jgi:dTDP-4-amino-4,6-dideoxygalactose transaminase
MHKQPVYNRGDRKVESGDNFTCITTDSSVSYVNGVSESIFKVGMCLPAGPYVSDDDVRYIVKTIKEAIV